MAKKRVTLTVPHHRRPRSLDGTNAPGNISYVQEKFHKFWHTLFGNMNAYQIANHINEMAQKPESVIVVCKFINGVEVKKTGQSHSKNLSKIDIAWRGLSRRQTFRATINYINNVWLDPSYHLYVEKRASKRKKRNHSN